MIGIIDYGAGNLDSVKKALFYCGSEVMVISSAKSMAKVKGIVLPGVGSYGQAARNMRAGGMDAAVLDWLNRDRPFLGICLGMQLLFDSSPEDRTCKGLAFFKGDCRRLAAKKVPQIGWNLVRPVRRSRLLESMKARACFYFLHSYYVVPEDERLVSAKTDYSVEYASMIERGNLCAVQFHPEKSGMAGIKFLKKWVSL